MIRIYINNDKNIYIYIYTHRFQEFNIYDLRVFTLDAGLLARSQSSEGPATGHLDTDHPSVDKERMK